MHFLKLYPEYRGFQSNTHTKYSALKIKFKKKSNKERKGNVFPSLKTCFA